MPDLVGLDLPALVRDAGYPGTRIVPALSWLLSLLALKLTRTRRVSHVDDLLLTDPATALFAGLATLPKKSALTDYSYRTGHDHQRRFLAALDTKMIDTGLVTGQDAIFDLDFHAVMHWGHDPALEKHYVPTRSQRARSVLTFFAQDTGTHNLVYANADLTKSSQNREVITFCDHWKAASGNDPHMLIMDQKVTTHAVLGELDARGVRFLTLRMRSPALVRQIDALTSKDVTTVTLDRPARFNRPKVHEANGIRLTGYPGTVRQLIVTGLGRDAPTVIITNDHDLPTKALIAHYARRMTIEQRLAEIIQAFHADALSSAVNLNVDLDIMLCVLAQALTAALRNRLPGYHSVTPDVLQRRFLETPAPSSPTTTPSPSASTDAPTHPCSAKPTSPPTPKCPGGATAPSTTNSADPLPRTSCVEIQGTTFVCQGGLLLRGTDDKGVCVLVVTDRLVHEQFPNRVAVLSDRNEGGFLLVVCHRSLHEHRRDLVPIRSENDKLQASGILEVLRRFGTCRDHRDSSLLVLWLQQSIPETSTNGVSTIPNVLLSGVPAAAAAPFVGMVAGATGPGSRLMAPAITPCSQSWAAYSWGTETKTKSPTRALHNPSRRGDDRARHRS